MDGVERKSDRELVITRRVNGPVHLVYEACSKPELFRRWWVPKSLGLNLLSCDMDVRVGGTYKLVFAMGDGTMAFHGRYLEVTPPTKLSWSNDESGEEGAITTITLTEEGDKTLLTLHELYASKEACDAGLASGAYDGMRETFEQLDELVTTLVA